MRNITVAPILKLASIYNNDPIPISYFNVSYEAIQKLYIIISLVLNRESNSVKLKQ